MTDKTMFRLNPAKNPFLGNLPEAAMEDLLGRAKVQQLKEGETFIREGEPSDSIYFVNYGEVVILKRGVEIDRQRSGGVIGEMGVLTKAPRSATIKCAGDVELLRVEAGDFIRIVDSQPAMLRQLVIDQLNKVTSSHDVREKQGKQIVEAKEVFGRLVSPEVYERVISKRKPEEMLSGTLEDAAVLFFDIRGFSTASEKMGPQPLLKALNEHLAIINARVAKHRGTIVNFIGDAVLAIFGCPVPLPDAAGAAVRCYLEAREELNAFHQHRKQTGEHCFELGAGINTHRLAVLQEAHLGHAAQRPRAQPHVHVPAELRHPQPLVLQVGQLPHLGLVVGVADAVANQGTLTGELTDAGHDRTPRGRGRAQAARAIEASGSALNCQAAVPDGRAPAPARSASAGR